MFDGQSPSALVIVSKFPSDIFREWPQFQIGWQRPDWVSCLLTVCVTNTVLVVMKQYMLLNMWEMMMLLISTAKQDTVQCYQKIKHQQSSTPLSVSRSNNNKDKKNFQRTPVETSCCKSLSDGVSLWPHGHALPAAVVGREPVSLHHIHRHIPYPLI